MGRTERLVHLAYSLLDRFGFFRLMAAVLAFPARRGIGSDSFLKRGYLPVPVHFHSPIPDLADLEERKVWSMVSRLPGIDFRPEEQLRLLTHLGRRFGAECGWPLKRESDGGFHLDNPSFRFGCAASTHCMIREHRPHRVIEIGSGMSTRVILAALAGNERDTGQAAEYRVVDPYPSEEMSRRLGSKLVQERVERLDPGFFSELAERDVLFIDSSHSVKIGSDVNFLFLEVLPRLQPGVIVHVHDIALPYEYVREYAVNPAFRQFWTEQYLLQAFLCCNPQFEVLLGMNYLMTDHLPAFRSAFATYEPDVHLPSSGSFWIRRTAAGLRT